MHALSLISNNAAHLIKRVIISSFKLALYRNRKPLNMCLLELSDYKNSHENAVNNAIL